MCQVDNHVLYRFYSIMARFMFSNFHMFDEIIILWGRFLFFVYVRFSMSAQMGHCDNFWLRKYCVLWGLLLGYKTLMCSLTWLHFEGGLYFPFMFDSVWVYKVVSVKPVGYVFLISCYCLLFWNLSCLHRRLDATTLPFLRASYFSIGLYSDQ